MSFYENPVNMFERRVKISEDFLEKALIKLKKISLIGNREEIEKMEEEVLKLKKDLEEARSKVIEYKNSKWNERDVNNKLKK